MIQVPYKKSLGKKLYPLWFMLPFIALVVTFFVLPCVLSVWMAFTDWNITFDPKMVGLKNFQRILKDPYFMKILGNTLLFVVISEILVEGLAIFIAILTQYFVKNKMSRYLYRTVWLSMNALPSLVYVIVMKGVFDGTDRGIMNQLLMSMGMITDPIPWFNDFALGLVICTTGFLYGTGGVILLSAAVNSIPEDYFKAARIDGASEMGIVRQIVLPLLRWTIMYQTVQGLISFFSGYMYIMLLTDGGPNRKTTTLALYAYQNAFVNAKYGYGAAITIIVLLISIVLVMILFKIFNFDEMVKPPRIDD